MRFTRARRIRRIDESYRDNELVTVCDACETAVCWHGEMMCWAAEDAGTKEMTVKELDDLGKEDPSYYSPERLMEICGGRSWK